MRKFIRTFTRLPRIPLRQFCKNNLTEIEKAEANLSEALTDEIVFEKLKSPSNLFLLDWKVNMDPVNGRVSLVKDAGEWEVEILFNPSEVSPSRRLDLDEEEENILAGIVDELQDEFREEYSDFVALINFKADVFLLATGQILDETFELKKIGFIDELSAIRLKEDRLCRIPNDFYLGPDEKSLSPLMKDSVESFLIEAGLNEEALSVLKDIAEQVNEKQRLDILQQMKAFLSSN